MISKEKSVPDASILLMNAVWVSDDANDEISAFLCRIEAIHTIDTISSALSLPSAAMKDEHKNYLCMRLDLLRRTRNYKVLIDEYDGVEFQNDFFNGVVHFQLNLAKAKDHACHYLDEYHKYFEQTPDHKASSDSKKSEIGSVKLEIVKLPIKNMINLEDAFGKPVQMAYYGEVKYRENTYYVTAPDTADGEGEPVVLVQTYAGDSDSGYTQVNDTQTINEVIRLLNESEPEDPIVQPDNYDPLEELLDIL